MGAGGLAGVGDDPYGGLVVLRSARDGRAIGAGWARDRGGRGMGGRVNGIMLGARSAWPRKAWLDDMDGVIMIRWV